MREIFEQLVVALDSQRLVAYCRLVETRGSTPQKAGAVMLVYADGSQTGTLGGGCVEAEVKRQAIARLLDSHAEIATFQLDHDYGWDDGLICGGRMKVLIQPILASIPEAIHYFQTFGRCVLQGLGCTELVAFETASGLPLPTLGLFQADHHTLAKLPAEAEFPAGIVAGLKPLSTRPRPYVVQGCAALPLLPRCRLVIVGGGHVGQSVAQLASELEFDVCVLDDRPEMISATRFPTAHQRLGGEIAATLASLEITSDTYCLIVTRGHQHDEEALFRLIDRGARYVG